MIAMTPMTNLAASPEAARSEEAIQATLRAAIGLARYAPSLHNSQPWAWRITGETAELATDPRRAVPVADPCGRETMLGCGAALHHARTALAAAGWRTRVTLLPDPRRPTLVARIELTGTQSPHQATIRMAAAISRRRADRGLVQRDALPAATVAALRSAVERETCHLTVLTGEDVRGFEHGVDERPAWAILYSDGDSRQDELRAGQAMSALMLTATDLGVTIGARSQPVEVAAVRARLDGLLPRRHGQFVLRLGRPDPPTSRAGAPAASAPAR
jgi:nitroreductase